MAYGTLNLFMPTNKLKKRSVIHAKEGKRCQRNNFFPLRAEYSRALENNFFVVMYVSARIATRNFKFAIGSGDKISSRRGSEDQ